MKIYTVYVIISLNYHTQMFNLGLRIAHWKSIPLSFSTLLRSSSSHSDLLCMLWNFAMSFLNPELNWFSVWYLWFHFLPLLVVFKVSFRSPVVICVVFEPLDRSRYSCNRFCCFSSRARPDWLRYFRYCNSCRRRWGTELRIIICVNLVQW